MDNMVTLGRGHVFALENYKRGAKVWHRHPRLVWIGGELIDDVTFETKQIRIRLDDDSNVVIDIKSLDQLPFLRNPGFLVGKDDLTLLSYLHEPAVLHNLYFRFVERQSIYTYCGIVLVAINPYADFSHLYGEEIIQVYRGVGKSVRELDPHIFAVAEEAYYDMREFSKSQSIIVSGESGAGKTVATKFVMRYLASVAANRGPHEEPTGIEQSVLASNPIMESIGNAKTVRNDNSSRFGKYVQMNFCDSGSKIAGAEIKTYLLEKSRVVVQASGERNYHVFYQMCAARNHSVLEDLHLGTCESYSYLVQGGDSRISGVDDKVNFEALLNALTTLGFSHQQSADVFRIFAGILMLGNVHFESGEASSAVSTSSANDIARLCSELWQIDENALRIWLTRREIRAVNEVVTKALTKNEAVRSRDALAKMLYSQLFNHLVDRINDALDDKEKVSNGMFNERFIGVLDIYGFETFEKNSFEQLCINYANETLQQQFNQHVFKLEQEEYVREEIQWVQVDFQDNQPAIDLIEGPVGLINLLDEQCKRLNGSDVDWLSQLSNSSELKRISQLAFPPVRCNDFIVRHFAADVTYTTDGFVEKNRDAIEQQLLDVVALSGFEFMRKVIGSVVVSSETSNLTFGKRFVKKTVASQFRDSLKKLMTVLCSTRPHYVRCIKPNDSKTSFVFEPKRGMQQLRACGVLDTVKMSAAGFPSKFLYEDFARRYRMLNTKEKALWRDLPKQFSELACQQFLQVGTYAAGKTKIFLQTGGVAILERIRMETLATAAAKIQKMWKGRLARRKYVNMKKSVLIIQASVRAFLAFRRMKYLHIHQAAIVIQASIRGFVARCQFRKMKAFKMQASTQIDVTKASLEAENKQLREELENVKQQLIEEKAKKLKLKESNKLIRQKSAKCMKLLQRNLKVRKTHAAQNRKKKETNIVIIRDEKYKTSRCPRGFLNPLTSMLDPETMEISRNSVTLTKEQFNNILDQINQNPEFEKIKEAIENDEFSTREVIVRAGSSLVTKMYRKKQ